MNPYRNQILTLGAAAMLAIAPAAASGDGTGHAAADIIHDTLQVNAAQLLDSTPLFDRIYLEAVNRQLHGDDSTAMALFDSCLSLRPDAAEVYYRRAQHYTDSGNDSLATAALERAAQLQPANDTYQESVAETYIDSRDYDSAIKAY